MRDKYPSSSLEMDIEEIPDLSDEDLEEVVDLDMESDNDSVESIDSVNSVEDETSQKAMCIFRGHSHASSVFCGCLSQNGELAVTGSKEDLAYIWDTTTGNIVLKCTGHTDSVIFAEFNHDDNYLATGDMKGLIQVWSKNVCCSQFYIDELHWMKWHHSANILLAASENGEIYMWKLPKGQCKIFHGNGTIVESGAIFPDGKSIVVGCRDGTIRIIDLKEGTVMATIPNNQGHSSLVTDIDCHMNNKLFISVSTDGKTILSTAHNGKIICVLQDLQSEMPSKEDDNADDQQEGQSESHKENWAETVSFCKDPAIPLAATATVNGELFVWDISKQVLRHKIDLQIMDTLTKVRWKGNTSILFVAGLDGVTRCIDAKTGKCLQIYKGHKKAILDLHISQNEQRLLTVSDDSTARVYDISSIS
ncbi:PREDICTED: angio-associated migratory cell protein [Dinoponera quadriceps]|uniref:Angio-associated migratory cell protein n=1 Tax=Dinoponera quadriceps TaxID=609295 RepID=A0A6P3XNI1_DINQU|nr:PREDICTED: angio-associated migratory cell protein [Dinoponera quadriceps]